MTDRPIIFNADMIRALLGGRKTQTRRLLNPQPPEQTYFKSKLNAQSGQVCVFEHPLSKQQWKIPLKVQLKDRLWVRETWNAFQFSQDGDDAWPCDRVPTLQEQKDADELGCRYGAAQIVYRESERARKWFDDQKWRPSIHMPRWASRLTLIVTDVRVQRLQDISRGDAMQEGCPYANMAAGPNPISWFSDLWNSVYGPEAWDANPWVTATTFTVHRCNIDQIEEIQ